MNTRKICPQCFRQSSYYKVIKGKLSQECSYCGFRILKYQVSKALATRRTNRITRERALRRASVVSTIKSMSVIAGLMCVVAFFTPQSLTYTAMASETPVIIAPEAQNQLIGHAEVPKTPSCEEIDPIKAKVECYASKYGVESSELLGIIQCESSFNPNAKNISQKEASYGLVQINTLAHDVSVKEATDPDYAIQFLAKHWKDGKYHMWLNCSKKLSLI